MLVFAGWFLGVNLFGAVIYHFFPNKAFPIHSYGFMLALSFLLGIWFASVRAKKAGLNPNVIADVGFWVILSAIVGARAYYVALHFEEFQGDLLSIVNPFHQGGVVGIGGLVMYGGFIGAILASVLFFYLKKIPFQPYADVSAPAIGLGIALTRIGCFMNGCCYGSPAAHHGINFPLSSAAGVYQHEAHAAGLFPSQLYESAGGLLIVLIIILIGNRKPFTGFLFLLTGLLYSVLRFAVDFSRYYGADERLGGLSHNQIVCIVLFVVFGGLILRGLMFRDEGSARPPAGNGAPPPARPPFQTHG
jgi:phosphatidylglycerol:prolipoprotein diacylglycerol transferase